MRVPRDTAHVDLSLDVVVSAVKKAEADSSMVLRAFEAEGRTIEVSEALLAFRKLLSPGKGTVIDRPDGPVSCTGRRAPVAVATAMPTQ